MSEASRADTGEGEGAPCPSYSLSLLRSPIFFALFPAKEPGPRLFFGLPTSPVFPGSEGLRESLTEFKGAISRYFSHGIFF